MADNIPALICIRGESMIRLPLRGALNPLVSAAGPSSSPPPAPLPHTHPSRLPRELSQERGSPLPVIQFSPQVPNVS